MFNNSIIITERVSEVRSRLGDDATYYSLGPNSPSFAESLDKLLEVASTDDVTPNTEIKVTGACVF